MILQHMFQFDHLYDSIVSGHLYHPSVFNHLNNSNYESIYDVLAYVAILSFSMCGHLYHSVVCIHLYRFSV